MDGEKDKHHASLAINYRHSPISTNSLLAPAHPTFLPHFSSMSLKAIEYENFRVEFTPTYIPSW